MICRAGWRESRDRLGVGKYPIERELWCWVEGFNVLSGTKFEFEFLILQIRGEGIEGVNRIKVRS
jgi:hypothetical protein